VHSNPEILVSSKYKAICDCIVPSGKLWFADSTPAMLHAFSMAVLALMTTFVSGLGTSCSAPITQGTAAPGVPYWMETIKHQGTAAFNSNPSGYQVFRNVKVCLFFFLRACESDSPFSGFRCERRWCYRRYSCNKVIVVLAHIKLI
jgi:hypothetical protein